MAALQVQHIPTALPCATACAPPLVALSDSWRSTLVCALHGFVASVVLRGSAREQQWHTTARTVQVEEEDDGKKRGGKKGAAADSPVSPRFTTVVSGRADPAAGPTAATWAILLNSPKPCARFPRVAPAPPGVHGGSGLSPLAHVLSATSAMGKSRRPCLQMAKPAANQ